MPETTKQLLGEVRHLNDVVVALDDHVTVSQNSVRRLKIVTIVVGVLTVLSILLSVAVGILYTNTREAQIANCENRNEQNRGHLALWTYVINTSRDNNPGSPLTDEQFYVDMQRYIGDLYPQRDCDKPVEKYVLPDTPEPPKQQKSQ